MNSEEHKLNRSRLALLAKGERKSDFILASLDKLIAEYDLQVTTDPAVIRSKLATFSYGAFTKADAFFLDFYPDLDKIFKEAFDLRIGLQTGNQELTVLELLQIFVLAVWETEDLIHNHNLGRLSFMPDRIGNFLTHFDAPYTEQRLLEIATIRPELGEKYAKRASMWLQASPQQ